MDFLRMDTYHIPRTCAECGGVMIYKGVGEYRCEDCNRLDFDDYGKVRLYIEQHKGATALEIEAGTGVSQKTIRQMLRESRLQIAAGSKSFLHCERCGKAIRSGVLCPECEMSQHRMLEEQQRKKKRENLSSVQGYGSDKQDGAHGEKRFRREDIK